MTPEQRTWIEKMDERICRVLQETEDGTAAEALYWMAMEEMNWDLEKIQALTPLLEEYGKPPELIEEMRRQWKDFKQTPPPSNEDDSADNKIRKPGSYGSHRQ